MRFLKALLASAIGLFAWKKTCAALLAYGCEAIMLMEPGTGEDRLPGVFELDLITARLNSDAEVLEEAFGLEKKEWTRDETRALMEKFAAIHDGFCRLHGRRLSVFETMEKIIAFEHMPFSLLFKANRELLEEGRI